MTDWPDVEPTLERLREWLDQVRAEAQALDGDGAGDAGDGQAEAAGLVDLVREFTALRHDVKLQAKGSRNLEEQTAAAVTALQEAARQFRAIAPRETEAVRRAATPLVEALADLDEALRRGQAVVETARRQVVEQWNEGLQRRLDELEAAQPGWKRWLFRQWRAAVRDAARQTAEGAAKVVDSLADGYTLVRARLQRAMAREGLERLVCVGRPVDPHAMTVVEAVDDPERMPGTVVEEIRPGYLWKGDVLRFAEVRAVRAPAA